MSVSGEYFKIVSNSPCNTEKVCLFLKEFIQCLNQKNIFRGIFVLDNVKFHHSQAVNNVLYGTQFTFLFLPPYSPFLNPIENSFSKWKNVVKSMHPTSSNELIESISNAANLFSLSDFQGYWLSMARYISKSILREEIDS